MGELLAKELNTPFIIDGDEFRKMFTNINYGREGREENIRNANAVATYLNKKSKPHGHIIISLVNPYERLRKELRENNKEQVVEVFLKSNRELRKEYHVGDFEIGNPEYVINTDQEIKDSWKQLKGLLIRSGRTASKGWQAYSRKGKLVKEHDGHSNWENEGGSYPPMDKTKFAVGNLLDRKSSREEMSDKHKSSDE